MKIDVKKFFALVVILHMFFIVSCVSTSSKKASPEKIAEANVNLAAEYFRLNRVEEALSVAKKAYAADSDSLSVNLLLALIYQSLEQPKRSEKYFLAALDAANDETQQFGVVHNNYGVFLCQQSRLEEADAHFLIAVKNKFYKTPLQAMENSGICALKRENNSYAEKYFRKILKMVPKRRRPLIEMAKIQYSNENFLSSRAFLQRYHDVTKSNAISLLLAIKIESKLNANSEVIRLKKELKSRFPESEETLVLDN